VQRHTGIHKFGFSCMNHIVVVIVMILAQSSLVVRMFKFLFVTVAAFSLECIFKLACCHLHLKTAFVRLITWSNDWRNDYKGTSVHAHMLWASCSVCMQLQLQIIALLSLLLLPAQVLLLLH
jgi:hypothetical protein